MRIQIAAELFSTKYHEKSVQRSSSCHKRSGQTSQEVNFCNFSFESAKTPVTVRKNIWPEKNCIC